MMKKPLFFGIHAAPPRYFKVFLSILPFIILIIAYFIASDMRHTENPSDKILPTISKIADGINQIAFTENRRTGQYILWSDTYSSLTRLLAGMVLAIITALFIGLNMGAFPGITALGRPLLIFVSMVPPLAILPILLITFGIGQMGKIALIFLGTFPFITRDVSMAAASIPKEQITKALTLGASQTAVVYKIILPQVLPRLVSSIRLSLGAGWLFLIASEAIASTDGLGYRIFLVRRYLSMDIIIPYVLWITLLGFVLDFLLKTINQKCFRWNTSN
jgi:NitT/TauT family transport system permease protein